MTAVADHVVVGTGSGGAGTCRTGSDPMSVVTPRLEVRGVNGLRVADALVMPTIIRGHTHAPSMAIGARAVDLISAVFLQSDTKGKA